jgi:lipoate-protein ligase B
MQFWSLKELVPYSEATELQKKLVELRASNLIPDTVIFLEHAPVVTRGRGLQWTGVKRERSIPLAAPLPSGVAFCESERGGDLTYHGPGQLVVYPIVKLDSSGFGPSRDITAFLRQLESVFVDWLNHLGLQAESRENATGVWANGKKVASIGIAVRKWVVWHGLAINMVNDLGPFHWITPCGFSPEVMASVDSLLEESSLSWDRSNWRRLAEQEIADRFLSQSFVEEKGSPRIRELSLSSAQAELAGMDQSHLDQ